MATTTKMKPFHVFVPFTKIERKGSTVEVEGYCFVNEVVDGEGGIRLLRSAMEAATPDYMKFGAIREMHQPSAAGTALEALWDEKGCLLRSKCVDPVACRKIEEGVYKGYSVGVNPKLIRANAVEACEWPETSYVDRPKDWDAVFNLYRVEGFDPNAEVEVTVLDETPVPAAAGPDPEAVAVPDPASLSLPATSQVPSGEDSPSADPSPAQGASSSMEEGRAPIGDASRLWAALAPTVEESVMPDERRALLSEYLVGLGVAETIARDMAARTDVERALTSDSVPVRENLEGGRKPRGFMAVHAERQPEMLAGGIMDAHTSLAHSLYSILDSDADDKPSLIKSSVAEYADHVNGLCRKRMARAEDAAALTEELGALARLLEHGEGYGVGWARADGMFAVTRTVSEFMEKHGTREAAEKRVVELRRADKPEGDAMVDAVAAVEASGVVGVRYTIIDLPSPHSGSVVVDRIEQRGEPFASREAADARLAQLQRAAVEAAPAAPGTVSRSNEREETTELQRLETANAELTHRLAAHEETVTRLAAAEAEVQRLEKAPLDRAKPVARFTTPGLVREFLANRDSSGGGEDVAMMRRLFEQAEQEAANAPDRGAKEAAIRRMLLYKEGLREAGVTV